MPVSELQIVEWIMANCPNDILLPQNFIHRLMMQMTRNVRVMPSEQDSLDWIWQCLNDLGPPNGDFNKWQSEVRMCLADCKTNGRYVSRVKKLITIADTLEQFK